MSYTVKLTDGVRVKHGTQAQFQVKSGRSVLESRVIPVEYIGGAITTASVVYNGLAMSGGISWRHPGTGQPLERPHVDIKLRPEDVLEEGQLCDCEVCQS